MQKIAVVFMMMLVTACSSVPEKMTLPPPTGEPRSQHVPTAVPPPRAPVSESLPENRNVNLSVLQSQLGMDLAASELGSVSKPFDACKMGVHDDDGTCGPRFFTVVRFRMLCRDSEGTVEEVVNRVTPLFSDNMKWKIGELNGATHTDSNGFGQVQLITKKSPLGQRFVLIVGKQFLGLQISQVSQIVVPVYWCTQTVSR